MQKQNKELLDYIKKFINDNKTNLNNDIQKSSTTSLNIQLKHIYDEINKYKQSGDKNDLHDLAGTIDYLSTYHTEYDVIKIINNVKLPDDSGSSSSSWDSGWGRAKNNKNNKNTWF